MGLHFCFRWYIAGSCALFAACASSQTHTGQPTHFDDKKNLPVGEGKVQVRFDRETSNTVVRILPPQQSHEGQPDLLAGATFEGQIVKSPQKVFLGFRSTASKWRFSGCKVLRLTTSKGKSGPLPLRRETQIGGPGLTEYVYALLPFPQIKDLSEAPAVEVNICEFNFSLKPKEMENLRKFVQELSGEAALGE